MEISQEPIDGNRRVSKRLSGFSKQFFAIQRPLTFSWQEVEDHRRKNPYNEPIYERIICKNAVLVLDVIIAIIRRELDGIRPELPRINFSEIREYIYHNFPQVVLTQFNQLLDFLFKRSKPQPLQGRDALLNTDLLQFKQSSSLDDSDTDDAISVGASTVGMSVIDKAKTAELEAELAKIKENMSSVFEAKMMEMQATIEKQAKTQADMQEKMNALLERLHITDSQSSPFVQSCAKKASTGSIPTVNKSAPPPPPLPPMSTSFGKNCPNFKESNQSTGRFESADQSLINKKSVPKSSIVTLNVSKVSKTCDQPVAYDYRSELALQLQKRREAIEKNQDCDFPEPERPKRAADTNPIVSSMLGRIPAPSSSPGSRFNVSKNSSYFTDEDEWN